MNGLYQETTFGFYDWLGHLHGEPAFELPPTSTLAKITSLTTRQTRSWLDGP